jgi:hypothetical protein
VENCTGCFNTLSIKLIHLPGLYIVARRFALILRFSISFDDNSSVLITHIFEE